MPILIIVGLLIVVIVIVVVFNDRHFERMVSSEIASIFADSHQTPAKIFSEAQLEGLPQPLQTYLKRSLQDGQAILNCMRLKQSGRMRLKPNQNWMPFKAEQYFTANPPVFLWLAKVRFMPLIWVKGRDKYVRQQGNMLIKVLSTIIVANGVGPKIAVGAFVRYIAERIWFPTALLPDGVLRWEAVDATTARAIACDSDVEAIVTFHFDAQGDVTRVSSGCRYWDVNDPQPTKWHVNLDNYQEFGGVRLPVEAEVVWETETGDFPWWQGTITELEYNIPRQY